MKKAYLYVIGGSVAGGLCPLAALMCEKIHPILGLVVGAIFFALFFYGIVWGTVLHSENGARR